MHDPHPPAASLPAAIDACVIDLDGTLTVGAGLTRGAAELLAATHGACVVLSNNSSHTPAGLATELARLGLDVPPERILLAGAHAVGTIAAARPGARVLLLGSAAIMQFAIEAGLALVERQPQVVLLTRDPAFSYQRLGQAANAVRAGASLVVANADLTHPGPDGTVVPETGALFAALQACCPEAPAQVIGKPGPALFRAALRLLGSEPSRTLVIGDNPSTDGEGAARAGMPFLRVHDCDVREAAGIVRARMR